LIYVKLTNGFGNNLFQYNAARMLADYYGTSVTALAPYPNYYGQRPLENLGVTFGSPPQNECLAINGDSQFVKAFNKSLIGNDVLLSGYFEDYRFFLSHRDKIKTWYPSVEKRENNDLVLHMRTGDRLFMKNEFYLKPKASDYVNAIDKFHFDQLYIVTDMPTWKHMTEQELSDIAFHTSVSKDKSVPISESVEYFNSFVLAFEKYRPIVQSGTIDEDFNFIRSFDNILFEHGTLSWWASFLSDASKIGVYGPWRPWKGTSNKNLSKVPLEQWFKWE
tara:strand:- start:3319 stop:4149 length:831 start_codon:yes stop_codon:yes gene_type:complete